MIEQKKTEGDNGKKEAKLTIIQGKEDCASGMHKTPVYCVVWANWFPCKYRQNRQIVTCSRHRKRSGWYCVVRQHMDGVSLSQEMYILSPILHNQLNTIHYIFYKMKMQVNSKVGEIITFPICANLTQPLSFTLQVFDFPFLLFRVWWHNCFCNHTQYPFPKFELLQIYFIWSWKKF